MATTKKPATATRKSTAAGRKPRTTTRSTASAAAPAAETSMPDTDTAAPIASAAPTDAMAATAADTTATGNAASDGPEPFRRPDLIQAVADRTELKRNEAKMVLELVLEELGKALDEGDELVLQPLGKLSVKKRKTVGGGEMLTVKLKRNAVMQQAAQETPLADPAADS